MIVHDFVPQSYLESLRNQTADSRYTEWPNVLVHANRKRFSKHAPESALSIITNTQGTAHIAVGKKKRRVCEESFFLLSPFQQFDYDIDAVTNVSTQNVHFNYQFVQDCLNSFFRSDQSQLDQPDQSDTYAYTFDQQLHYKDPTLQLLLKQELTENYFIDLLQHLLQLDRDVKKQLHRLQTQKKSTELELMKRMLWAKDYIYSNYHRFDLSVDALSQEVAMSKYHFLRVFKKVFYCTPYQYVKQVRLARLHYLLENTELSLTEIAHSIGYQEVNTIFPLVKKYLAQSPTSIRKKEMAILNSTSN